MRRAQLGVARARQTGLPPRLGTSVLLQHQGQPRTPFYTEKHLTRLFEQIGLPESVARPLASLRYKLSPRIKAALAQSGSHLPLDEYHNRFSTKLTAALDQVLPEFSPFRCQVAHFLDEGSVEGAVDEVVSKGTDRLVILPLYPFPLPHLTVPQLKAVYKSLEARTRQVKDLNSGLVTYLAKNSPVSFHVREIPSLGVHESFVRYFAERIAQNAASFDSIVFAVPLPGPSNYFPYKKMVLRTCQRITYALYEQYPFALPHRVALFPSWSHVHLLFSLTHSIGGQIRNLAHFGYSKPLIVPIGSLFKDYDSESVLRRYIGDSNARVLSPTDGDPALVHSLAELVKTELLTEMATQAAFRPEPVF